MLALCSARFTPYIRVDRVNLLKRDFYPCMRHDTVKNMVSQHFCAEHRDLFNVQSTSKRHYKEKYCTCTSITFAIYESIFLGLDLDRNLF